MELETSFREAVQVCAHIISFYASVYAHVYAPVFIFTSLFLYLSLDWIYSTYTLYILPCYSALRLNPQSQLNMSVYNLGCRFLESIKALGTLWTIMCRTPFVQMCVCFCVAGHRHQGWCRRHSGIRYLIPVPEHSGTGLSPLVPLPDWFRKESALFFIPVPDWPDAGQSGIYKKCTNGERHTLCACILLVEERKTIRTSMDFLMLTNYKYILECREKVSPTSAFLPVICCISPAPSAFRYQGQPGTAGCGLFRHCPDLVFFNVPQIK